MEIKGKRFYSVFLILSLIVSMFTFVGCDEQYELENLWFKTNSDNLLFDAESDSYSLYLKNNKGINDAKDTVALNAESVSSAFSGEYKTEIDGIMYAFIDENSQWIEWEVNVEEDSFYVLGVDYRTVTGTGANITVSLTVDGKSPYSNLQNLALYRRWQDDSDVFEKDYSGNDILPAKREILTDVSTYFYDENGYYSEPYKIALIKGKHIIRLSSVREGVLIKNLLLSAESDIPAYAEYYDASKKSDAKNIITIEAEHPSYTNSSSIYAVADVIDVATTPNSPSVTKLNAFGDSNWKHSGQEATWDFYVEKSGYYYLNIRARQDYSEGMSSYRTVKIDGEIPFKEATSMSFDYDFKWQSVTFGDDEEEYKIWLDEGKHEISLVANPGEISDILLRMNNLILDLNTIYRKIIIITGTEVDVYQDYNLDEKIPELLNSFKDCYNRLKKISKEIKKITGLTGSRASVLDETASLLMNFVEHPYEISGGLSSYKTKVDDIASLLTTMSQQALLIDKINFVPVGQKIPEAKASLFKRISFSLKKFVESYIDEDKKETDKKTVDVWVSTGRDQAQIIKQMVDNDFEKENNHIAINLSIVDTGTTLIQASLANKGPDVALLIAHDMPVNLAMRGGLLDLNDFDIDSIYDNYYESAWEPFRYQDGIYAIPETQVFDMMFVRNDIFEEIGIAEIPQTWDDFYKCLEKIQNNNLMVGISETNSATIAVSGAVSTFSKFYFQKGGTYYNNDFSAATFNSELAISCLSQVCELYTKYGLDRQFDFFNRFRSGELIMGITSYTMYNQLIAAAPEIAGLWSMYPIPGTVGENGEIMRQQPSTGTGAIILKDAEKNGVSEEAWEFLKWWSSVPTQTYYAEKLENAMGTAARYTPANIGAFETINWTKTEREALVEQWEQVYNVREIPGNYYISRALTSAIRNTINEGTSIRFNISKYNNDINSEIMRKRQEFGIN